MGCPIPVFAAVLGLLAHHSPGATLNQEQQNALIGALGMFDWTDYHEPVTPFPPCEDVGMRFLSRHEIDLAGLKPKANHD